MSNITEQSCHKEIAPEAPPVLQNGKIVLQAYHVGWIISGSLALISIITSFWLIGQHLRWYTNKKEQRYIVRLLFMVPLYALISFCSFLFWLKNHATPIILVRDAYEAIVLTAFFYLLLMYVSHDVEEQRRVFLKKGLSVEADVIALRKGEEVDRWMFPLGFIKWKPKDGLYFLQLMKWGVLQYCVIRPTTTLAAVILDYMGLYCEDSWGLGWGHIYITIVMSISVTIAMYCLIQLYMPISKDLAKHKPLLKLFSVKAVVFLTFWQATFLSVLTMFGVVKATKYMTVDDVNTGIGAVLETFEMMIFAFLHIRAFTYKPYQQSASKAYPDGPPLMTPRWRSLRHAMDFRETFREIWVGCIYMFDKMKGKEPTPDFGVIRETHYESAFGRPRPMIGQEKTLDPLHDKEERMDPTLPTLTIAVDRRAEVEIEGERQWLALDRYDRGGLLPRRERSEGLQAQIDHELERLGHPTTREDAKQVAPRETEPRQNRRQSWWHSFYNRFSQSGNEAEVSEQEPLRNRRFSLLRSSRDNGRHNDGLSDYIISELDDPPPRSILQQYKANLAQNNEPGLERYYDHRPATIYEGGKLLLSPREDSYGRYPNLSSSPPSSSRDRFSRTDHVSAAGYRSLSTEAQRMGRSNHPDRSRPYDSVQLDAQFTTSYPSSPDDDSRTPPPPVPPKSVADPSLIHPHPVQPLNPRRSRHTREPANLPLQGRNFRRPTSGEMYNNNRPHFYEPQ